MEQPEYLINTNAIIDYLGRKLPSSGMNFMDGIIDSKPNVSIITKIEILSFNAPEEHYQVLINFINDANIIELTDATVDTCIGLRKNYRIRLPDAIIAATSLANDLILITRNISDFKKISGLDIIDPYHI